MENVLRSRILSLGVSAKLFLQHVVVHCCGAELGYIDLQMQVYFLESERVYQ